MPRIDDQLDRLGKSNFFMPLDMTFRFYQIRVAKDSIYKTAFFTPDRQFEYLRMSFGLANALAVFQQAINLALGKLKHNVALVYLDDVLIPSLSIAEELEKLDLVLDSLLKSGLTINIAKCRFHMRNLTYLERQTSCERVRPNSRKIIALEKSLVRQILSKLDNLLVYQVIFENIYPDFFQKFYV